MAKQEDRKIQNEKKIKLFIRSEIKKEMTRLFPDIFIAEKMYFILTYDRIKINDELKESAEKPRPDVLEVLKKCGADIVVCPDYTTIFFDTILKVEDVLKIFSQSPKMSDLSYSLYPIGVDLNGGILNRPKTPVNETKLKNDYYKELKPPLELK